MYKNVKITLAAAILYVLLVNIQNSLTLSAICKIIALYCYLIYSEGWISHYYIIIYVFHLCLTNYEIWYISKWDYRSRRTMKRMELEMYSIDCIIFWIQLYVILDSYG